MTTKLYPADSIYSYIDKFEEDSISAHEDEWYFAWLAYKECLTNGQVDKKLIPYLDKLFEICPKLLVPIFSCEGHEEDHYNGYVLFRSTLGIEDTITKAFVPVICTHQADVQIHVWPNGAIGYSLKFKTQALEVIMPRLLKRLEYLPWKIY
jgi:hypothetical protein